MPAVGTRVPYPHGDLGTSRAITTLLLDTPAVKGQSLHSLNEQIQVRGRTLLHLLTAVPGTFAPWMALRRSGRSWGFICRGLEAPATRKDDPEQTSFVRCRAEKQTL
jgi:hypothetical protein